MRNMKKIILAPDSFKGSLDAAQVCSIEAQAIRRHFPDAEIHAIPMADGGEGMVDAYLKISGGERVRAQVSAPLGGTVTAEYGILPNGYVVMEMAAAAGLPLVQGKTDPLHTSTYGVGEMLLHAAKRGAEKVLLGLGGSCTNDCGIGMAAALGFRFLDEAGQAVEPLACNLGTIRKIVAPERLPRLELMAACDVDNPLLGQRGATYTYGPQKGADAQMLSQLEAGMTSFAKVLEEFSGRPVAFCPGAGAAGGMGAMVLGLLGGKLMPGAQLLLESVGFDGLLEGADMVFTGEGRMDWQSAFGKVPGQVAARCKAKNVPCIALCGSTGKDAHTLYDHGITAIFTTVNGAATFEQIQKTAAQDLEFLTDSVLRLMKL